MQTFHFFGLSISFLGLMTAIGITLGLLLAVVEVKRKELNKDKLMDIGFYAILSGVIGARLFYVLFYNLRYYLENPIKVFSISEGGMSIHGGLLTAFVVSYLYVRKQHLNFLKYADAVAPSIILGQAIGRIGCDVFGKAMKTPLIWGVEYHGQLVHPVQVYEFVLNYVVFILLWRMRKKVTYEGQLFLWYIILFSLNRGIVEFFRINPSVVGWFSISHLLSVLFIIVALIGMQYAKKRSSISIAYEDITTSWYYGLIKDIVLLFVLIFISSVIFYYVQT